MSSGMAVVCPAWVSASTARVRMMSFARARARLVSRAIGRPPRHTVSG